MIKCFCFPLLNLDNPFLPAGSCLRAFRSHCWGHGEGEQLFEHVDISTSERLDRASIDRRALGESRLIAGARRVGPASLWKCVPAHLRKTSLSPMRDKERYRVLRAK